MSWEQDQKQRERNSAERRLLTRKKLITYCLSFPGAYEDYPFDKDPNDPSAWTALRHSDNRKCFAFLFEREGILNLNLKCEPEEAAFLRRVYPSVRSAYHMNREHWNGILLDGSIPKSEIFVWLRKSYELTELRKMQKLIDK